MTAVEPVASCPQCGEPIPYPAPALCRRCSYPLVFVDRSPRLEASAKDLATPTSVAAPKRVPPPPPPPPMEAAAAPAPVAVATCPSCGYGNAPDRAWCERCGSSLVPASVPAAFAPAAPTTPGWHRWLPGLLVGIVVAIILLVLWWALRFI